MPTENLNNHITIINRRPCFMTYVEEVNKKESLIIE